QIGDRHLPAALLHRHVVIHAYENTFSANFQVIDRQLSHKSNQGRREYRTGRRSQKETEVEQGAAPERLTRLRRTWDVRFSGGKPRNERIPSTAPPQSALVSRQRVSGPG